MAMHIASFKIENYKSFRDTPEIALTPGFNVIVGQNNVGKTALVEALSLRSGHVPHRSLKALPTPLTPARQDSAFRVVFRLAGPELLELLRDVVQPCWVPVSSGKDPQQSAVAFNQSIHGVNDLHATFQGSVQAAYLASYGELSGVTHCVQVKWRSDGALEVVGTGQMSVAQRCDYQLATTLQSRVYAFRAERLNVGVCRFGQNTVLQPNASNLAEVLDNLQADPAVFDELNGLFSRIFPTVRRVTVRPAPADQVEVFIWTERPETRRLDLAMSLGNCGTGLGQVLAMLYVVLTAQQPRIIVIDEPQSFLHPGAVRKLVEILKQYPQHQFVITTHSPTAVIATDPETLLHLRIDSGETFIDRMDVKEARDLRAVLADVGARLSDVFGADAILWVEGMTEEQCFPKILGRLTKHLLLGTAIVGVMHTGDFEPRRAEATVRLYEKLTGGRGLLPPAVGFIFDRDGRSDRDLERLRAYPGVTFLPRRMYENYLLNPAAIATIASSVDGFRSTTVTVAEVEAWLNAHRWDGKYFDSLPGERTTQAWLNDVHGKEVLGDLFSQLSEARVQYDNVRYGIALTDWLVENAPEELREVAKVIERALADRQG